MSNAPLRSYARLASAILLAALVIGAAIVASSYLRSAKTETSTSTFTSTVTTTATQTTTTTQLSTTTSIQTQISLGDHTLTTTSTTTQTVTSTTTTNFECIITGEPAGIFVRVLSDSGQTPVAGALVIATNEPAYCGTSPPTPATAQRTVNFTTSSSTQWYPLNNNDDSGYSFIVAYSGQTYTFHASMAPLSTTCVTLYVPSGRTNTTITEFQSSC